MVAGTTPAVACSGEPGLTPMGKPLPHLAQGLRDGHRLDVLAVGNASMTSVRAGPEAGFPSRTVQMLREARPGADIRLVTRVERGATAADLLAILRRELASHPALVLWQAGTAEAARDLPPEDFAAVLRDGVGAATAAGSDIVLIDPPFSRLLTSRADPGRYRPAFDAAAQAPGAAVFSRFDLTRHWVEDGQIDVERAPAGQRAATLRRLHECLANALSRGLLSAADSTPDSAQR